MSYKEVYLGLGGNVGNTVDVLLSALDHIAAIDGVINLRVSAFYSTTPVSSIPQASFVNAACALFTTLSPGDLFDRLQTIMLLHGQGPKPKDAPRILDIDILHFGGVDYRDSRLEIPHPRWSERLFVLKPLLDLCNYMTVGGIENAVDIASLIDHFPNRNHETVTKLEITTPMHGGICTASH